MSVVIRRAKDVDVAGIRDLFYRSRLPVATIGDNIERFVVMLLEKGAAPEIVGAVGALEYDGDAVMRYMMDGPWRGNWEKELLRLLVSQAGTLDIGTLIAEVNTEQQVFFEALGFRKESVEGHGTTELGTVVMTKTCGSVNTVFEFSLPTMSPTLTPDARPMMYSYSGWKTRPQRFRRYGGGAV